MNPLALARLLRTRSALAARLAWTSDELVAHRVRALGALRKHAYTASPFYRSFHRGLERAPLADLPVLTKATLMDHFDEVVTDPRVRLDGIQRHLESALVTDRYLDRYRVAATGGTTGRRGLFLSDPDEWNMVLASYSRSYAWAGLPVGLTHPLRMAIVSSTSPSHQSSIVGATVRNPLVPTLRLDAGEPLERTVAALNRFKPRALVGYASILGELAAQQRAGALDVAPGAVFSASEVLTPEIRAAATAAWGNEPFDVYAATETAGIASACTEHHLHLYADLVIAEPVDERDRPVIAGVAAEKLLVTVLFSRTQPLIRYELTDRVRLSTEQATDLGPFKSMVAAIEGRTEDILEMPSRAGGTVRIHPNVFHSVLEKVDAPWQVIRKANLIRVLVAGDVHRSSVAARIKAALTTLGVAGVAVEVERVRLIPRTASGKAPLIRDATRDGLPDEAERPPGVAS